MTPEQQTPAESKTQLVEQINSCLRSGEYSRALDLLRGTAAEFPNDGELSELEKLAHDGIRRKAEADRLITESQELFAQRKPVEAIRSLREAYELDETNSLARAILANALVEHAHSLVETDWLAAETLANQALALNPAHPTAKTIYSLVVDQKETSSVEDWVSHARKLQSAGDLFAALAWVAEGLAVHPNDPKLLQVQDSIQRDQGLQRRQNRRRDLEDLRRMELEIGGAADVAAKQALAERIQAVAATYWTDGEILSIANALLLRLGLVPRGSSTASPNKGAAVILHVPRPSATKTLPADTGRIAPSPVTPSQASAGNIPTAPIPPGELPPGKVPPSEVSASEVEQSNVPQSEVPPSPASPTPVSQNEIPPSPVPPNPIPSENVPTGIVPPSKVLLSTPPRGRLRTAPPKPQLTPPDATVPPAEHFVTAAKFTPPASLPKQPTRSNSSAPILVSATAAAILVVAAIFFFARKHPSSSAADTPLGTPAVSTPAVPAPDAAPAVSAPAGPAPALPAPTASAQTSPAQAGPAQASPEPSSPELPASSDTGKLTAADQPPPTESGHDAGSLLVVTGQDGARVALNQVLQRQLTQAGQLRLTNLEPRDYVVQVFKSGFQDPSPQTIRIRKGEQARLIFNLQPNPLPLPQPQPQPRLASLTIQGGTPGSTVFVDQTPVGTIQPDGALSVSAVNPGDHTVELRKERFQPRQFKEHFVAGVAISLAAADAALEGAPGELKITFAPPDAKVAIVNGDLLKMVSSGVPLSLAAGTYTLSARTADRFTRFSTLEVAAGQSRTLDLSLAPSGMSKWDDPGAWKPEKDSFLCKGGEFVLYGVAPASGTFVFSAMLTKGHLLQWVLNYSDPKNYVLFQMDDENFYRAVIRNGEKTDEIRVPNKGDKKNFRTLQIHVSPTELVHQINRGNSVTVLDRWTKPGANLSLGKFGFYIPGNDEVALSSFAYYADLNIR